MGNNLQRALDDLSHYGIVIGVDEQMQISQLVKLHRIEDNGKEVPTQLAKGIAALLATSSALVDFIEPRVLQALIADYQQAQEQIKNLTEVDTEEEEKTETETETEENTKTKEDTKTKGIEWPSIWWRVTASVLILKTRILYIVLLSFVFAIYVGGLLTTKRAPVELTPDALEKEILKRCPDIPGFGPIGTYTIHINTNEPAKVDKNLVRYTVKNGDTLSSIAKEYKILPCSILKFNTLPSTPLAPELPNPGTTIYIPLAGTPEAICKKNISDILPYLTISFLALLILITYIYLTSRIPRLSFYSSEEIYKPAEPQLKSLLLTKAEKLQIIYAITQVPTHLDDVKLDIDKSINKAVRSAELIEPEFYKQKIDRYFIIGVHNPIDQSPLVNLLFKELTQLFKQHRVKFSVVRHKNFAKLIEKTSNKPKTAQATLLLGTNLSLSAFDKTLILPANPTVFIDLSRRNDVKTRFQGSGITYVYAENLQHWLAQDNIKNINPPQAQIKRWSSALAHLDIDFLQHINKELRYQSFVDSLVQNEPLPENHELFGFRLLYAPLIKKQQKSNNQILQRKVLEWVDKLLENNVPVNRKSTAFQDYQVKKALNEIQTHTTLGHDIDEPLSQLIGHAGSKKLRQKFLPRINEENIQNPKLKKQLKAIKHGHSFVSIPPLTKWGLYGLAGMTMGGLFTLLQILTLPAPEVILPEPSDIPPIEMVQLPAGRFCMGSTRAEYKDFKTEYTKEFSSLSESYTYDKEKLHLVDISSFAISKYEITYQQFKAWLDKSDGKAQNLKEQAPKEPAVNVDWFKARQFCQAHGLDLPSEYQWEYAARAGKRQLKYGSVSTLEALKNIAVFNTSKLEPVGSKQAVAGLHDMLGNAWEWTLSEFRDYKTPDNLLIALQRQNSLQVPENTSRSVDRVVRGGSFVNSDRLLRSADRLGGPPVNWERETPRFSLCVGLLPAY